MMGKVNVLLVDDRPEGLVTLEAVLGHPDYNLICAGSGTEALAHILAHDFAVILMDVQMPELDGFETAKLIKQREKSRNIPIIFLTANNEDDSFVTTGYSVGAVDYVFKPFDSHVLKSKVAVFVDLYRKNQQLIEQANTLHDIERRDRVRMIADLEIESRRRYENLADAIPQIIFRIANSGVVEYFNQFWYRYTGMTFNHSIPDIWIKAVHPKDFKAIYKQWLIAKRDASGFETECRFLNGETKEFRWHLFKIVPEFNALSEIQSWIGTATDIHDQKVIQQELLAAKKMADVANETKTRFLANMSHEIRTPLGAILGFSELLLDAKTGVDEKVQCVSTIRRNGDLLTKIIDEILDISKVESGKLDLELTSVSVVDLLNDVKSSMTLKAKEKKLDLKFSVQGQIPLKILSNPTRLQQILVNVIGNAIKFSPEGSVQVKVSHQPKTLTSPSYLCFNVQDSGPGLTTEQIGNLFQPFTQVDISMTRKYGGTGLGLALSKKLAVALGGNIEISESAPGEGCDFRISVQTGPLHDVEFTKSLDVKRARPSKSIVKNASLEGIKILLVEDSVDNQVLVSRFLSMEGADVDLASNGREGLGKAFDVEYDLVLMDIQMPELDGYGALKELRKRGFKKPIVALTAHGMVEEREKCLRIGFDDHLTKPVNRIKLIDRVQYHSRCMARI